jgi:hypothetical protein
MSATLVSLLRSDVVPVETLRQHYGSSFLELTRAMLGVVPNSGPYLEIWPAGFRTCNVIVPNLLNMPFSLWGFGAPRDIVGLAMYVRRQPGRSVRLLFGAQLFVRAAAGRVVGERRQRTRRRRRAAGPRCHRGGALAR